MKNLLLVFLMAASMNGSDIKPITGQNYRDLPDSARWFFAGGYYMGFWMGHHRGAEQEFDKVHHELIAQGFKDIGQAEPTPPNTSAQNALDNCLSNLTIGQAGAILDKYLSDHPERWDKQIMYLAEEAFIDACEKRANKP